MKKALALIAALLLVGAGCANAPAAPSAQAPDTTTAPAPSPAAPTGIVGKPTNEPVPNPAGIAPANSENRVVVFDGEHFLPANVAVHVGGTVTWQNNSKQDMWPQADANPTGSANYEFDPRVAIHPGQSWSYTFNHVGNWPYHNTNTAGGVVEVTPVGK